jgi:5-methylcytosine-specific restriction endonuclease McrA
MSNPDLFKFISILEKETGVPKSLKNKLWNDSYIGVSEGKCYCCRRLVTSDNFHAGHIISVNNGGETNINNLRIVCAPCNLSMRTMNLEEYRIKYFESNEDKMEVLD